MRSADKDTARTRDNLYFRKSGRGAHEGVAILLLEDPQRRECWAELDRRFRSEEFLPVGKMLAQSRAGRGRAFKGERVSTVGPG